MLQTSTVHRTAHIADESNYVYFIFDVSDVSNPRQVSRQANTRAKRKGDMQEHINGSRKCSCRSNASGEVAEKVYVREADQQ